MLAATIATGRFIVLWLIRLLPFAILVAYGYVLVEHYSRYLDRSLNYLPPEMPGAPEDILGLGFWVFWLFVAIPFSVACILSYRLGRLRRAGYWVPLIGAFVIISGADFYLYGVLEQDVLSR